VDEQFHARILRGIADKRRERRSGEVRHDGRTLRRVTRGPAAVSLLRSSVKRDNVIELFEGKQRATFDDCESRERPRSARARSPARRDLFMAPVPVSQMIFFASRLFSDIHMHARELRRSPDREQSSYFTITRPPHATSGFIYSSVAADSLPRRRTEGK